MVGQKLKELNIELDQKLKERTKELKDSIEKLRLFMESSTDGFVLFDPELNYVDVNNVSLEILGINREDLIGKNILDIAPSLKETGRYDKYLDVLKTGKPFSTEDVIFNRLDERLNLFLSVRAFKVGENLGIIFTDISERKKAEKESRLHSQIVANMSEGVYLIRTSDLEIVWANPKFEEIFGYNPGEMIGKKAVIVNAPTEKTPEETASEIVDVLERTGEWHGEVNNIKKDGTPFWCYANVSVFNHPEYGKVILAIHTDITDRKKADEKLITSEYNLRERVKELSCLYGLSQLVDNPDISLEEIIQGTLYLIHSAWQFPEIICATIKYDKGIFQTENFIETKWKLITNLRINEKLLIIEVYYLEDKPFLEEEELLINEIGKRLKIFIEQKEAEQKLKESEEKYRHLFNNSPISVMLFDFEGTLVDCNTSTENLFGDKKDELIGKKFIDLSLKSPELTSILNENKENLIKKKKIKKPFELKIYREDGTFIWINLYYSLFNLGNETFILVIIQEITERKKAEEIIKEEIEKLKELDKAKSNFIIRVSHELKTPLNNSFSTSNLLLKEYKDQMDDSVKELVEIINDGGLRMKKLIDNMLDTSKIEANMLELKCSEENLTGIINECVNEISYLLKKRNIVMDIDLPKSLPLEVDRFRIKQVFLNLLINGIKNTPPKGKIFIYLIQEDHYFDINIRDTGIGLTEEEKLKIFKKFGKIERYGKDMDVDIEGSGLGLYISKEIVQLHGGQIYVISEGRNKGTTMTVRLQSKKPL